MIQVGDTVVFTDRQVPFQGGPEWAIAGGFIVGQQYKVIQSDEHIGGCLSVEGIARRPMIARFDKVHPRKISLRPKC